MIAEYETVADIIADRDALRKDAERYRWLRIKCGLVPSAFGIGQVAMTLAGSTDEHDAKRLDAHIDAAMNGANARIEPTREAGSA